MRKNWPALGRDAIKDFPKAVTSKRVSKVWIMKQKHIPKEVCMRRMSGRSLRWQEDWRNMLRKLKKSKLVSETPLDLQPLLLSDATTEASHLTFVTNSRFKVWGGNTQCYKLRSGVQEEESTSSNWPTQWEFSKLGTVEWCTANKKKSAIEAGRRRAFLRIRTRCTVFAGPKVWRDFERWTMLEI